MQWSPWDLLVSGDKLRKHIASEHLCTCRVWQANFSLVASKRDLPRGRKGQNPDTNDGYCEAKTT